MHHENMTEKGELTVGQHHEHGEEKNKIKLLIGDQYRVRVCVLRAMCIHRNTHNMNQSKRQTPRIGVQTAFAPALSHMAFVSLCLGLSLVTKMGPKFLLSKSAPTSNNHAQVHATCSAARLTQLPSFNQRC